MNDLKIIYKILKALERGMGDEDFDVRSIGCEAMGIAEAKWEQLLILMAESGYIDGVAYSQSLNDKFPHIGYPITPRITLKGLEYLNSNIGMQKAKNALNGIVSIGGPVAGKI
jgi:hypothetical protein